MTHADFVAGPQSAMLSEAAGQQRTRRVRSVPDAAAAAKSMPSVVLDAATGGVQ